MAKSKSNVSRKTRELARTDPNLSAQEFFTTYVSTRTPVVIKGLLNDPDFQGRKWTDLSYLSKKASDVEVMVEPIHPTANQYGTDVERISMSFRSFLDSLQNDDGPHPYLTTQYSDEDPDAETVFPPPTNALKDEFPIVPRLMGNLFLQQVNLWIGKSKDGSSSGLHHDFHDNLYCLLQGRKRFVLFPPSEIKHLYPYGTLDTLHPNGLISYEDTPVRADGLSNRAACKARVGALERKIDALKAKMKTKTKGNEKGKERDKAVSKELKALMDAHDEALDELAMLALEGEAGEDEVDDFDALMAGLEDVEDDLDAGPSTSKPADDDEEEGEEEWKGIGHSDDSDSDGEDEEEGAEGSDSEEEEGEIVKGDDEGSGESHSEPSSFSRIPTAYLHSHLDLPTTATLPLDFSASSFPGLRKTTAPYVVELSAGEMLYLPASWWHEVTSTSSSDGGDVHMAFNYWFYPPDSFDDFNAPYADSLVWDHLRTKGKEETPVEGAHASQMSQAAAERVHVGKRAGDNVGNSKKSKKARR